MKIYNRKVFISGIFMLFLGVFTLFAKFINNDMGIQSVILILALIMLGFGSVMRSISQKMAKEAKLTS